MEEILVCGCEHLVAGHRVVASGVGVEPPEAFDLRVSADDGEAKPVRIPRRALLPALDRARAVQRDRCGGFRRQLAASSGSGSHSSTTSPTDRSTVSDETVAHVDLDAGERRVVAAADLPRVLQTDTPSSTG